MAGQFIYFIEGVARLPEQIHALEIPGLRKGDGAISVRETSDAPKGARKGFLAWIDQGRTLRITEKQNWSAVPEGSNRPAKVAYWVGVDPEFSPKPADLARTSQISGRVVQLSSGDWNVPQVRMLPRSFVWSPEGKIEESAKAEYEDLFERAGQWLDVRCGVAGSNAVGDLWMFWLVADCLALNYRISRAELGIMRWIDTQDCLKALDAMIDLEALIEIGKEKKTPEKDSRAGSGSTPGDEAGIRDTARP